MTGIWGDVPTWLAGIATVAAVSVALAQVVGQRKRENDERAERLALARRAQAELVSAWVVGYRDTPPTLGWVVTFSNGSLQPIYDVLVVPVQTQGEGPSSIDVWKEHENLYGEMPYLVLRALPPGDSWIWVTSVIGGGVDIAFTDRAGRHWVRHTGGLIEEIDSAAQYQYDIDRPAQYSPNLSTGRGA